MERGTVWAIAGGVLAVGGLVGAAVYVGRRRVRIRVRGEGVDDEIYALARVIASEQASLPPVAGYAIGFAVRNHARHLGKTIKQTVAPRGWESQEGGGYVSTRLEPSAKHLSFAEDIIAGNMMDVTGGAEFFDSPRAQRALLARGATGYHKTPEQVARDRLASGLELVVLPGVPEDHFRMWRRAGARGDVS